MSTGWLIFLSLAFLWIVVLVAAWKTGFLEKYKMSVYGPFIMWRTERGMGLVDAIASKKKFWKWYGWLAIAVTLLAMVTMLALLIWIATIIPLIPKENAPSPRLIIGIPGVNPVIPIWQGILGLAVGIIIHEFAHGIMTRAQDLKLKSMGLLFAVIPMGAFAEPDEKDIMGSKRRVRMKVYAVGPASNIITALVFVLLFSGLFMGALTPDYKAPVVMNEQVFDIGEQLISVTYNGTTRQLESGDDLGDVSYAPGKNVTVSTYNRGRVQDKDVITGLYVIDTFEDSPAEESNISAGWIFLSIDGTVVHNAEQFQELLDGYAPGQTLEAEMMDSDTRAVRNHTLNLTSRYEYMKDLYGKADESDKDDAFMGVYVGYFGSVFVPVEYFKQIYSNPYKYGNYIQSSLAFIGFPLQGLSPTPDFIIDMYTPGGLLGFLPEGVYFTLADACYWIFWISLMVGLTNALPAIPLDGGYIFMDIVDKFFEKVAPSVSKETREKVKNYAGLGLALFVLALIIWQFVGPRI